MGCPPWRQAEPGTAQRRWALFTGKMSRANGGPSNAVERGDSCSESPQCPRNQMPCPSQRQDVPGTAQSKWAPLTEQLAGRRAGHVATVARRSRAQNLHSAPETRWRALFGAIGPRCHHRGGGERRRADAASAVPGQAGRSIRAQQPGPSEPFERNDALFEMFSVRNTSVKIMKRRLFILYVYEILWPA